MPAFFPQSPLARWQFRTALSLFVGYSAYYLCRSNLAVVAPLLLREFAGQGLNKEVLGRIASLGVLCYAAGKVVNGVLGDFLGGKRIFLLGMVGAVVATVAFGLGQGVAVFFGAWALNRLVQSMGWAGLVKITANWFAYRTYGRIMGLLSLSYLFGDIVAKLALGQLLALGVGWRGVFMTAAGVLATVALASWVSLRNTPESVGLAPPPPRPDNLFASPEDGSADRPASLGHLLRPYLRSESFRLMLLMSFGLTGLREAFSFWVPTYLVESAHLSEAAASQFSALYSGFGMLSILGAGYLSDGWLRGQRGSLILGACVLLVPVLLLMTQPASGALPLLYISLMGLLLLGPYSFLAGAMALDAGGRQGVATAAGLIDAVGYTGSTVALWLTGALAERYGWGAAFLALALLALATAGAALVFYRTQERTPARELVAN